MACVHTTYETSASRISSDTNNPEGFLGYYWYLDACDPNNGGCYPDRQTIEEAKAELKNCVESLTITNGAPSSQSTYHMWL